MRNMLVIVTSVAILTGCGGTIPLDQYGEFRKNPVVPPQSDLEVGSIIDVNSNAQTGTSCINGQKKISSVTDSEISKKINADFDASASVPSYVNISAKINKTSSIKAQYASVNLTNILDGKVSFGDGSVNSPCSDWIGRLVRKDVDQLIYYSSLLTASALTISNDDGFKAAIGLKPGEVVAAKLNLADASLSISNDSEESISITGRNVSFASIKKSIKFRPSDPSIITCSVGKWCNISGAFATIKLLAVNEVGKEQQTKLGYAVKYNERYATIQVTSGAITKGTEIFTLAEKDASHIYLGDDLINYEVDSIDIKSQLVNLIVTAGKLTIN